MVSFKEKIEYYLGREKKTLQNFYLQPDFEDWHISSLSKINAELAYYNFLIGDLSLAKNYFSIAGHLDIYLVRRYNKSHSRFLDFDIPRCLIPLLSDQESMIQEYGQLRYSGNDSGKSMDDLVMAGESPIWCNTIQFFMSNNLPMVERNLDIIETITLKKLSAKESGLLDDYEFYRGLYYGNLIKMEEILRKLVSAKIHKKRNDDPILSQYVSLPALGYAKLAWRRGFNIDIGSDLIPHELLPITPLQDYEIPYEFLKP